MWAIHTRCYAIHVSQTHSLVYILSMLHSSTVRCFTVYIKVCSYVGFTTEHKVSCYPCSTAAQSGVYCPCFTAVQCFTAAAQEGVLCPWLSAENAGLAFFLLDVLSHFCFSQILLIIKTWQLQPCLFSCEFLHRRKKIAGHHRSQIHDLRYIRKKREMK